MNTIPGAFLLVLMGLDIMQILVVSVYFLVDSGHYLMAASWFFSHD